MSAKSKSIASGSAPTRGAAAPADPALGNKLEKIRDILFGEQVQDIEHRLETLAAEMRAETAALRKESEARLGDVERSLRAELKAEIKAVGERQHSESEALKKADSTLEQKLAELRKAHDDKLSEQARGLKELRDERLPAVVAKIEEMVEELRLGKADRALLAEWFHRLAEHLSAPQPGARRL